MQYPDKIKTFGGVGKNISREVNMFAQMLVLRRYLRKNCIYRCPSRTVIQGIRVTPGRAVIRGIQINPVRAVIRGIPVNPGRE